MKRYWTLYVLAVAWPLVLFLATAPYWKEQARMEREEAVWLQVKENTAHLRCLRRAADWANEIDPTLWHSDFAVNEYNNCLHK